MSSDHQKIRDSHSAKDIEAFCVAQAQELGLTLAYPPYRSSTDLPAMEHPPYGFVLSVAEPFEALIPFYFTCEEVIGYATGTTKAVIEHKIRHELESRLREHVIASQEQSCSHGRS